MNKNIGAHTPNRLLAYQQIHETVMNQFCDTDFVSTHTLKFFPWRRLDVNPIPQFRLNGEIGCRGRILIDVDKYLDILEDSNENPLVQTVSYAYNASIQGLGNIIRYDNQDDYFVINSGHLDKHHKHIFDWRTNQQLWGDLVWVGHEKWPTLGQFLEEIHKWYWDNREELTQYIGDPDTYPVLGKK